MHHSGTGYGTGAPLLSHDVEGQAHASHDAGETLLEIYNAVREGADAFLMAECVLCLCGGGGWDVPNNSPGRGGGGAATHVCPSPATVNNGG